MMVDMQLNKENNSKDVGLLGEHVEVNQLTIDTKCFVDMSTLRNQFTFFVQ